MPRSRSRSRSSSRSGSEEEGEAKSPKQRGRNESSSPRGEKDDEFERKIDRKSRVSPENGEPQIPARRGDSRSPRERQDEPERKRERKSRDSPKDGKLRSPSRRRDSRSPSNDRSDVLTKVRGSLGEKAAPAPSTSQQMKDLLTTRTGGAYIPPAKLRLMQEQITDKASPAFQRLAWEALKKSINGLINKVNSPNIGIIVRELFAENIVRGRGLLCQSIMTAQIASPTFTHVYAALVSIINTKFPNIGELLLKRLILNFKRGFKRNDKTRCVSSSRFVAHLVNQQVAHEVLSLEILTLLLQTPTDDSVEVAIAFLKECGQKLTEVSPRGIHAIFDRLRNVLHESSLDKRTQYMIEVMFQVRKDGFKDNPAVPEELDVVEEDDQFTHMIGLDDATNGEEVLNVFKHDPEYEATEAKYQGIKKELLDEDSSDDDESGSGDDEDDSSDDDDEKKEKEDNDTSAPIIDQTETNMIALRRTIYLTIQSSLDFEESVHKLIKLNLKPGHETELCHMVVDCCAQQRTYEKFFGLMAQRLCQVNKVYVEPFQNILADCYSTVHRLEIGKLRNVARIFGHLFFTDAISWEAMACIHLNENETTSSSRIFIKILFQELAEFMGLQKLNDRIRDATLQVAFEGLFPRDDPANTRFSINFFTNIGLGALTEDLRAHLKANPKPVARVAPMVKEGGSSDDSDSSSSSSSSSEDSEEERRKKKKKKKKQKKKAEKKKEAKRAKRRNSEEDEESSRRSRARHNDDDDDARSGRRKREDGKRRDRSENKSRDTNEAKRRDEDNDRKRDGTPRRDRHEEITMDKGRQIRRDRDDDKSRDRDDDKRRDREENKSRESRRDRDVDRSRDKRRDIDQDIGRDRDEGKSRDRDEGKSRDRDEGKSRDKNVDKSRDHRRDREQDKNRDRHVDKSRDNRRDRNPDERRDTGGDRRRNRDDEKEKPRDRRTDGRKRNGSRDRSRSRRERSRDRSNDRGRGEDNKERDGGKAERRRSLSNDNRRGREGRNDDAATTRREGERKRRGSRASSQDSDDKRMADRKKRQRKDSSSQDDSDDSSDHEELKRKIVSSVASAVIKKEDQRRRRRRQRSSSSGSTSSDSDAGDAARLKYLRQVQKEITGGASGRIKEERPY